MCQEIVGNYISGNLFVSVLNWIYAEEGDCPKIGLILSGGGAKGIAHIGALKVLEEAGIPIDYISGTSMDAIVGALYSIGCLGF